MSDDIEPGMDAAALAEMALLAFTAPLPQYLLADGNMQAEGRRVKALELASQFDIGPDDYLLVAQSVHSFLEGHWKPPASVTSIKGGKS